MVLPVTAILFAVVAAFATTAPKALVKTEISRRGGTCVQEGVCDNVNATAICTYQNDGATPLDSYLPSGPVCNPYSAIGIWKTE